MIAPARGLPRLAERNDLSPKAPRRLSTGSVVAGRFRLEKLLGEGGMGAVWSARHTVTQRAVAIKFLKEPADRSLIERFVREAQAANAVRHPNVVEVHDVFDLENGFPAMVMDLFEGESLASTLERGPLSLSELARIMAPVVSALAAIHAAGVVHRDLKPDNIFMARLQDGSIEPKILDFGICKLEARLGSLGGGQANTTAGRIVGTPCYMSPEQVRGAVDIDRRVDVWALGVILFECVVGKPPWDGDSMARVTAAILAGPLPSLEEVAPDLPTDVANAIDRMLVRDRDARLSDLAEVCKALQGLTNANVSTPRPVRATPAQSQQLQPGPPPQRDREAQTVARPKLTTFACDSVSSIAAPIASKFPRKAVYFAAMCVGATFLGGFVAWPTKEAPPLQAVQSSVSALPPADESPASPARPPVEAAPSPIASPATASITPLQASESPQPARATPEVRARPVKTAFTNGLQDFGGRR
jgi:serine/threonine-protein kinase